MKIMKDLTGIHSELIKFIEVHGLQIVECNARYIRCIESTDDLIIYIFAQDHSHEFEIIGGNGKSISTHLYQIFSVDDHIHEVCGLEVLPATVDGHTHVIYTDDGYYPEDF